MSNKLVVHCKKEKYDIYIGRQNKDLSCSKWNNPFVLKNEFDRDFVVLKYELYLNTRPDLLLSLHELKGKVLGCWCSPRSCHGDVLSKMSESKYIRNWFSNMLPLDTAFLYQGIEYKTSENFYQAMKLPKDRLDLRQQIANMNPFSAKKEIKKLPLRDSWSQEESLKVMRFILEIKFAQGTSYREKLNMTEDWEIVEWNNWNDTFWGRNINNKVGENNLGKILMDIR